MKHESSKKALFDAHNTEQRQQAIIIAINNGMPLQEIEEYLDWLDSTRTPLRSAEHTDIEQQVKQAMEFQKNKPE